MDTAKPQKEPLTCHDCGCEAEERSLPYDSNKVPCKWCERNPNKDINVMTDFYSENWVLTMLSNGKVQSGFDDPTQHDKQLLRLLQYAERFYGGDLNGERQTDKRV